MALYDWRLEDLRFEDWKETNLWIAVWASQATQLSLGGWTKWGFFNLDITPIADRSLNLASIRLVGPPMAVECTPIKATVHKGQIYAEIYLAMPNGYPLCLSHGYAYTGHPLTWPPGKYASSLEPPGFLRSITGTDPAAGVEIVQAVPTNARWALKNVRATLVTNGTAVSRAVSFIIDDGTNVLWQSAPAPGHDAGLTRTYTLAVGDNADETAFDGNDQIRKYLPRALAYLFQGWRIRTSTASLQAGDNWGAPRMNFEEWIED